MASIQNTRGIQLLLEAEKEADKIVQKGRQCTGCPLIAPTTVLSMKRPAMDASSSSSCLCFVIFLDRTQRLKEAKQEATKEIEDLKQLKLGELAVHETQVRLP